MIDFNAFFKFTYGLYIVSSGDSEKKNGYISNSVFQVTAEPPKFAATCNKDNLTMHFIKETGKFSVSVLAKDATMEIFSVFGYKSGRELDKFGKVEMIYGKTGVPVVTTHAIAFIECKVVETFDVGTHLLFIGELVQAKLLNKDEKPLSYFHYRNEKKAYAPKNAPTYIDKTKIEQENTNNMETKKYKCTNCGYIYHEAKEDTKFGDLPNDWECPVCGAQKSDFEKI